MWDVVGSLRAVKGQTLPISLLTCHGVFYLIFNIILSKEKILVLIISMDFPCFILYNVNFK